MANLEGTSSVNEVAGVAGQHTAKGSGVEGSTTEGTGVIGRSTSGVGVWGKSETSSGTGGVSTSGIGVHGVSDSGPGVRGDGKGKFQAGVVGVNTNSTNEAGAGVLGTSDKGVGVWGGSVESSGVGGMSQTGIGVHGVSKFGAGVLGSSEKGEGIRGTTSSETVAAIAAHNMNPEGTGAAVWGRKEGVKGHAGFFEGRVWVSGDIDVGGDIKLQNADCAENFDISPLCDAPPGSVVRLTEGGAVTPCDEPYDVRVAGVISGAGSFRPGLLLDSFDGPGRRPVALFGKVFCMVDADIAPVAIGDLLTTSTTPGHAMKAADRSRALGAIIGKALAPLGQGRGVVPILVALN